MLGVAVVPALMIPPTPPEFRGVNIFMIVVAGFWAAMYAIEDFQSGRFRSGDRNGERKRTAYEDASDIFVPPPSPRPGHR
jgi:hypothetical protein